MPTNKTNKYSAFIDVVNEFITIGREKQIVHQFTEDELFDGRHITLHGKKLINFGSCSYLGLETDDRIKEASIDAIRRYGSQFSSSRTYTSFTLYKELEELLNQMFGANVILSTSSTLGHRSVIPILIDDNDAVIFDHQAHISMQDAGKELSLRGISLSLLRHNRLDELEVKLQALSTKYEKVWYFLDGIYSMYGDLAPIHELRALQEKYKNLYLYIDDAHGMSWAGKNGTGYVLSQMELTERVVLCSSLAKGFASAGGVFVFSDHEQYLRIKNWGGPLTYSGPQQPAVIGASIASAKIHLSNEIYQRQEQLAEKINYCNRIMTELNLPVISQSSSPIFFMGLGAPKVAYNMNTRLLNDGLHVNLGIYPAVPETCTGIRFALTLHHTKDDIEKLIERINTFLPPVLKEEQKSMQDIYGAFRSMPGIKEQKAKYGLTMGKDIEQENKSSDYTLNYFTSVQSISQIEWDSCFGDKGSFDWNGLSLLETVFNGNVNAEENWKFHYYVVRDTNKKIVLATFFTSMITKDDMLASAQVSKVIENKRRHDKYYLTSKTFMMGTLLTDGEHLYIDKSGNWKEAFRILLEKVWKDQDEQDAVTLILRDFQDNDTELKEFLIDQGFVKIAIEERHILDLKGIENKESFINSLVYKKRAHLKNDILNYEELLHVGVVKNASDAHIDKWYSLYENVKEKNLSINDFKLPKKLFNELAKSENWEVIEITLKETDQPIAVTFAYKNRNYSPVIVGLDYDYLSQYKIYKQMLFQIVIRAIENKSANVYLGLTASLEKRKLGAKAISNVAYIQVKDNYNLSVIELLKSNTANPI